MTEITHTNSDYLATNCYELSECSICLCEIHDDEENNVLPCSHKFHKECIDEWFKTSHTLTPNKDEETIEIQWQCPLCRFIMSDKQDMTDVLLQFSIIKFKQKRSFIMIFTFIDMITSSVGLYITGNWMYFIWVFVSYYGYTGAYNFYINHLRLYGMFCLFPLIFKSLVFLDEIDQFIHVEKIILNINTLSLFTSLLSIFIQFYLIHCIRYLSEQLIRYEYQIREIID